MLCSSQPGPALRPSAAWCSGCLPSLSAIKERHIWLVFGTRYEHGIYYKEEFEQIDREHPNFHYVSTLSRCQDDWQGCRGYVQDHVREIVRGRPDMIAYICGLNDMVDHNRKMLMEEMGWDRKQIVFERYD